MSLLDDGNGDRDVAEFGVVLEAFAEIFGLRVSHLQLKISICLNVIGNDEMIDIT